MNKKKILLVLVSSALCLTGCTIFSFSDESSNSKSSAYSSQPYTPPTPISSSSEKSEEYEEEEVDVSTCSIKSIDYLEDISGSSYASNFGVEYNEGINYGFYRGGKASGYMLKIYPYATLSSTPFAYSLPGSFSNENPIMGIRKIEFTYKCSAKVKIKIGQNKLLPFYKTFPASSSDIVGSIFIKDDCNYFRIETCGDGEVFIKDVKVYYDGHSSDTTIVTTEAKTNRIAPTIYNGELVSGESTVSVPIEIEVVNNKYTVKKSRTYTYYSYEYVRDNYMDLNLDEIAMTNVEDVCNYFMAFGCAPANYANIKNCPTNPRDDSAVGKTSNVRTLFGDKARGISKYNRGDGYATSVPMIAPGTDSYYELDIGVYSGYSTSSRDVCRVVCFYEGWAYYNPTDPVCVFTDDHYNCFREYSNYGIFGDAFDTMQDYESIPRTNARIGKGVTYTKA